MTSADNGVNFDIDADGTPDAISWTSTELDVAFLVLDRNNNGVIDNGAELFGNFTPLSNGNVASNGFEALVDLDGGATSDGQIQSGDAAYSKLRLWIDRNHNGISEETELQGLASADVVSISTSYKILSRIDSNGNDYRYEGSALVSRNNTVSKRRVFDVFFVFGGN